MRNLNNAATKKRIFMAKKNKKNPNLANFFKQPNLSIDACSTTIDAAVTDNTIRFVLSVIKNVYEEVVFECIDNKIIIKLSTNKTELKFTSGH